MFWKTSNLVALICAVSLALLPWVMIFGHEIPWQIVLIAVIVWIVLGVLGISVRDGSSPRREKRDE